MSALAIVMLSTVSGGALGFVLSVLWWAWRTRRDAERFVANVGSFVRAIPVPESRTSVEERSET